MRRVTDGERCGGTQEGGWGPSDNSLTWWSAGPQQWTGLDQTRPIKTTSRLFAPYVSVPVSVSVSVSLCAVCLSKRLNGAQASESASQPKKFKVSPRRRSRSALALTFADFSIFPLLFFVFFLCFSRLLMGEDKRKIFARQSGKQ